MNLFSFAIVWWVLWKQRNKLRIEGVFPTPTNSLFVISTHIQRWKIPLGEHQRAHLEEVHQKLMAWTEEYLKRRQEPESEEEDFP
ncbi:unnamed protein product [Urochloa decumbens]|uniref:Uncharacterized protein n=1 Tax=Urochloa decumbens TaxID=240449 RepID=A0ABC8WYZ8_9POAL